MRERAVALERVEELPSPVERVEAPVVALPPQRL